MTTKIIIILFCFTLLLKSQEGYYNLLSSSDNTVYNMIYYDVGETALLSWEVDTVSGLITSLPGEIRFIEYNHNGYYKILAVDRLYTPLVQQACYYCEGLFDDFDTIVKIDINGDVYNITEELYKQDKITYIQTYIGPHGNYDESVGMALSTNLKDWTDLGYKLGNEGVVSAGTDRSFSDGYIKDGDTNFLFVNQSPNAAGEYYYIDLWKSVGDLNSWILVDTILDTLGGTFRDVAVYQSFVFYSVFDSLWIMYFTGQNSIDLRNIGIMYAENFRGGWTVYDQIVINQGSQLIGQPYLYWDTYEQKYRMFVRKLYNGKWRAYECINPTPISIE